MVQMMLVKKMEMPTIQRKEGEGEALRSAEEEKEIVLLREKNIVI